MKEFLFREVSILKLALITGVLFTLMITISPLLINIAGFNSQFEEPILTWSNIIYFGGGAAYGIFLIGSVANMLVILWKKIVRGKPDA